MQQQWINKEHNSKLIVFFNGWGMDERITSNLNCENFDVFSVCDYRSFEEIKEDFSSYGEKHLICWSMGVYIANKYYYMFKDFDSLTAINGTKKPIDDSFGIPEKIYNLMIDNYNELTTAQFIKKMTLSNILNTYKTRNDEELKQELISIRDLKPEKYLNFNKVIISTKDRIIPTKNQLNYWINKEAEIIKVEFPHYIFDKYTKWSELL